MGDGASNDDLVHDTEMDGGDQRRREPRVIDATSLHGLAHPLRVQLWEALLTYGSATATQLARRLGESSGATSYHLRQLERHGFVEEDVERGSGRDRWWRADQRDTHLRRRDLRADPATREAANLVVGEWNRTRVARLQAWMASSDEWPTEWREAALGSTSHLRLGVDELAALSAELEEVLNRWAAAVGDRTGDDLTSVEVQVNTFPIAGTDGYPTSGDDRDDPSGEP